MNNVDRIIKNIQENGAENILIHSIPGTRTWIVCQKIETDKWVLTLCDPMKNITYNLGTTNNKEHLRLWHELANKEIEMRATKIGTAKRAKEFRTFIRNFTSIGRNYAKFIKRNIKK